MTFAKRFALTLFCLSLSSQSFAADVRLSMRYGEKSIVISPQERGLTVFRRFNDLWILSVDAETKILSDHLTERALGIKQIEVLDVQPKGSGVRIAFQELPEAWMSQKEAAYHLMLDASQPQQIQTEPMNIQTQAEGNDLKLKGNDLFNVARAMSFNTREHYFVAMTQRVAPQEKEIKGNFIGLPTFMGMSFTSLSGLPLDVIKLSDGFMLKTLTSTTLQVMANSQKAPADRVVTPEFIAKIQQNLQSNSPSRTVNLKTNVTLMDEKSDYMTAMSSLYKALISIENFGKKDEVLVVEENLPDFSLQPELPTEEELNRMRMSPEQIAAEYNMPVAMASETFLPNYGSMGLKNFYDREKQYIRFLWRARTQEQQEDALLRWAKLKFFLDRYLDAVGILETAPKAENGFANNEQARLLEGAALAAYGRTDDAEAFLKTVAEPNADKSLWLAVVYAQQGKFEAAVNGFKAYKEQIKTYPPKFRQLVYYYFAKSLYQTGRLEEAIDQIDALATLGNLSDYLPKSQLLLAQIYKAKGQSNIAEQILVNLVSHPYLPAAHGAIYQYVTLLNEKGDITPNELIKHLENLRYSWRGDETERKSLLKLGQMYIAENQFEHGLSLLKYLSTYFPESLEAKDATNKLTETFTKLFLEGGADKALNLTESLSLYYAFRELTPPGGRGDMLIDSIVKRMRQLNLFDRAITLEEQQLKYRSKTPEMKAKTGYTLANLYFLNLQSEKALEVLKQTSTKAKLPQDLIEKRQHLLARVYVDLGQIAEVEKALEGVKTKQADYLRGEVYWRENKPKDFVKVIAPYFKEKEGEWRFEDNLMYRRLMISAALSGDKALIEQLEKNFPDEYEASGFGGRSIFLRQYADEFGQVAPAKNEENKLWEDAAQQLKGFRELEKIYNEERKRRAAEVTAAQKYFGVKGSASTVGN